MGIPEAAAEAEAEAAVEAAEAAEGLGAGIPRRASPNSHGRHVRTPATAGENAECAAGLTLSAAQLSP
jgi:hypothetical protein